MKHNKNKNNYYAFFYKKQVCEITYVNHGIITTFSNMYEHSFRCTRAFFLSLRRSREKHNGSSKSRSFHEGYTFGEGACLRKDRRLCWISKSAERLPSRLRGHTLITYAKNRRFWPSLPLNTQAYICWQTLPPSLYMRTKSIYFGQPIWAVPQTSKTFSAQGTLSCPPPSPHLILMKMYRSQLYSNTVTQQ